MIRSKLVFWLDVLRYMLRDPQDDLGGAWAKRLDEMHGELYPND